MGSQYGLLLASGARRYCRSAIRGSRLPFSLSPSRSPAAGMVVRELREEEGLVGRETFRWNRRHIGRPRG